MKLIKVKKKIKPEDHYNKAGLDDVARTFLFALRENLAHRSRRERFQQWNGYAPKY